MPAALRRRLVVLEMSLRVRNLPEVNVKRGPEGCAWRAVRNLCMARTGQVEDPVAPTNTVADLPKRSLSERFRWTEREFVVAEMSLRRRCLVFVNLLCVGQEYSLALRKP